MASMETSHFFSVPRNALAALPRAEILTVGQRWQLVHSLYAPWRSMVDGAFALILVAVISFIRSGSWWYALWAAFALSTLSIRLWGTRRYLLRYRAGTLSDKPEAPLRWARYFGLGAAVFAACWGVGAASVLAFSHDLASITITMMVLAGWSAGASVRNCASPFTTTIQLFTAFLPLFPAAFFVQDHAFRLVALLTILQVTAHLNIARHLSAQTVQQLIGETKMAELNKELRATNADLEEAVLQLHALSSTDALTGIANRRSFDETLAREWARATRHGTAISLLMIDVDHFKSYNDTYGHPAGDACLRQIAEAVMAGLRRPPDFASRFGGEEFSALLPGTLEAGASDVGERLRAAVEKLRIPHSGAPSGIVTISIGAACFFPKTGEMPMSLVKTADQALYRAKQSGRNRVEPVPAAPSLRAAV